MLIGIVDSKTKYVALVGVGFDKSMVGMIVGRVERILPEELVPVDTDVIADLIVQDVLSEGPCCGLFYKRMLE